MRQGRIFITKKSFVVIWVAFYLLAVLSPQLKVLRGNSDFLDKYTAARLLLSGQSENLYAVEAQKSMQSQILLSLNSDLKFAGGLLLFSHPPFVALMYAAVGWLSYAQAFLVWNLLSSVCFVTGVAQLVRHYRIHSSKDLEVLGLACLMYLPVFATLLQGQNTSVAFLCLVLAFRSFKGRKDFHGGLLLSLVLMKFQILPVSLLVLLLKKRWLALLGFLVGGVCLGAVSLFVVGPTGLLDYLKLLREMSGWVGVYGVNPIGANCLRGQMYLLFPSSMPNIRLVMTLFFNTLFVTIALICWRGNWDPESRGFDLKFALLIVVGLLVAPQINFHDLAFLLIPGVMLFHVADFELEQPLVRWVLFAVGFPLQILSFMILPIVPIQLNVVGLILLTSVLFNTIRSGRMNELSQELSGS